ncbi:MAG: hypothetical protein MUD00_01485 [Candidatus Pacebacteria bacterium]|jgi:hypothetical protein|nr:hypothetical protein [Candidatus Paceibacterota bacterium]
MRDIEKTMLENEFKGYIFHAFSDLKLQVVLPDMPTVYFWGQKKWHSDPPWFVERD